MNALFRHQPLLQEEVDTPNHSKLREGRIGCMLHYDGSSSDMGGVGWFKHRDCDVSYHWLVLDSGNYVDLAPANRRAWAAGKCRSSSIMLDYADANSAFYQIAVAAKDGEIVTAAQFLTVCTLVRHCFDAEKWSVEEAWRVVSHGSEAWPRGRKIDPEGTDPKRPVLSIKDVRSMVSHVVLNDGKGDE